MAEKLSKLPAFAAEAADELITAVMSAAAEQVTATRCELDAALDEQWSRVADEMPMDWAIAVLRLKETENEEMLRHAAPEQAAD